MKAHEETGETTLLSEISTLLGALETGLRFEVIQILDDRCPESKSFVVCKPLPRDLSVEHIRELDSVFERLEALRRKDSIAARAFVATIRESFPIPQAHE